MYGRHVIKEYVADILGRIRGPIDILDIGCGHCGDPFNVERPLMGREVRLHGMDFRPREHYGVEERVDSKSGNIEEDPLPFEDSSSLHALVLLLLGRQPPPEFVIGPHVRGFCTDGLAELFEFAGTFKMEKLRGSGFYPFSAPVAKMLSGLLPRYSVSLVALFRKTGEASHYLESLRKIEVESSFRGWTSGIQEASAAG